MTAISAKKRCAGCGQTLAVEEFYPKHIATLRDGSTTTVRDTLCRPCRREADKVEAVVEATFRREQPKPDQRVGAGTDFTLVAERMLRRGKPYMDSSKAEREEIVALAYALARKYHPDAVARKHLRGPVDGPARNTALATLMVFEASDSIPFPAGKDRSVTHEGVPDDD